MRNVCELAPLMTNEELAKIIYYKLSDNDMEKLKSYTLKNNCNFLTYNDIEINDAVNYLDTYTRPCPFNKDGECMLDNLKPNFCKALNLPKNANKVDGLVGVKKGIELFGPLTTEINTKALKFTSPVYKLPTYEGKKYRELLKPKKMKENYILYMVLNLVYGISEEKLKKSDINKEEITLGEILKVKYTYKLMSSGGSGIFSHRFRVYTSDNPYLNDIGKLYTKLYNRFTYYPNDYLVVIDKKINKAVKALESFRSCVPEEEQDIYELRSILMSLLLLNKYQLEFKNKSKELKGLYNNNDVMNSIKIVVEKLNKRLGLENKPVNFKLWLEEPYKCISEYIEKLYKQLQG